MDHRINPRNDLSIDVISNLRHEDEKSLSLKQISPPAGWRVEMTALFEQKKPGNSPAFIQKWGVKLY